MPKEVSLYWQRKVKVASSDDVWQKNSNHRCFSKKNSNHRCLRGKRRRTGGKIAAIVEKIVDKLLQLWKNCGKIAACANVLLMFLHLDLFPALLLLNPLCFPSQ